MNKNILAFIFGISGMTALIYEVVWSRSLQVIFGSTIYAVSTILTTFFVGFALGSYLFRNIADNSKNLLKVFAMLELGIGFYGLITLYLFKILTPIYLAIDVLGIQFVKFLLIFLVVIIPTTFFGAIWPVVNKIYIKTEEKGKEAGELYAFNSFGSFIGPLLAGFVLIPFLGIKNTSVFSSLLNIFAGILILIISRRRKNGV
jgi:spermidine synthase